MYLIYLQDEEVGLLTEVTHLQEIMDVLCHQVDNPHILPASSEQVINDLSSGDTGSYKFQVRLYDLCHMERSRSQIFFCQFLTFPQMTCQGCYNVLIMSYCQ